MPSKPTTDTGLLLRAARRRPAGVTPLLLEFTIDTYSRGTARILWSGGVLQIAPRGIGSPLEPAPEPSLEQWATLLAKFDELDVWRWPADSIDRDTCDGTQWQLRIHWPGRPRKRCYGSNRYPEGYAQVHGALEALAGTMMRP